MKMDRADHDQSPKGLDMQGRSKLWQRGRMFYKREDEPSLWFKRHARPDGTETLWVTSETDWNNEGAESIAAQASDDGRRDRK